MSAVAFLLSASHVFRLCQPVILEITAAGTVANGAPAVILDVTAKLRDQWSPRQSWGYQAVTPFPWQFSRCCGNW